MAYGPRMSDDLAWLDASAQAELVRRGEASPPRPVGAAVPRLRAPNPPLKAGPNPPPPRPGRGARSGTPWAPSRSTGGSSGGSAAAVAAGLVPAAHANDGGGSIRIPASECGLVGLKPSRGRISCGPGLGEFLGGLAIEGVLTRSVRDTAAILDAIAGPMPGDPHTAPPPARPFAAEVGAAVGKLRVGLLTRPPGGQFASHPDTVAAAEGAARLLTSLGHTVEVSHPEALDDLESARHFTTMYATGMTHLLDVLGHIVGRTLGPEDVDPLNWGLAEMGRCSAEEYLATREWIARYTRRVASWWAGGFDLLLTPTLTAPPPPLGSFVPDARDPVTVGIRASQLAAFTSPFNLTGQPAISLPLHWGTDGLPIGVQLVAAYGREELLIRVAAQREAARPLADRRPPIHA